MISSSSYWAAIIFILLVCSFVPCNALAKNGISGLEANEMAYFTDSNGLQCLEVSCQIVNPINCHNGTTGSVRVTVNGIPTSYSYNWSNGGTSNQINNLSAGTYTVVVSDGNGCDGTCSIELTEPDIIAVSYTHLTLPTICSV